MSLTPEIERHINEFTRADSAYGPHYRYPENRKSIPEYLLSEEGLPVYEQLREQQELEAKVSRGELGFGRLQTQRGSASSTVTHDIAKDWPDADEVYYWDNDWEGEVNWAFDDLVVLDEWGNRSIPDNTIKRHPVCPFLLYNYEVGFWWTPSFRNIFRAHITTSRKQAFMYRIMNAYAEMALHKGYPKENADGEQMHYPFTAFLKFFGVYNQHLVRPTRGVTLPPPKCMMHLMDAHMMLNTDYQETLRYKKWIVIYKRFNTFLKENEIDIADPRDKPNWRASALDNVEFVWANFFKDN